MNKQQPSSWGTRWGRKFAYALRGVFVGIRGQNSFLVHIPAAIAVVSLASWLQISRAECLMLILCVTAVFAAELFNSALEHLASAITEEENSSIRDALDIASGAVLTASIGAALVGLMVLLLPLYRQFF